MDCKSVCGISCDALNLNFMEKFRTNLGKAAPLWSRSELDFNNNRYYEFNVIKEEKLNSKGQIKHDIEYIVCYICDIQVPKIYFTDHKDSVRHKINTKIANLAMQRLQKYINDYPKDIGDDIIKSYTFFCQICVDVVHYKEKNNHELSVGHKNSVIVEKFLNDFLALYANDEFVDLTTNCNISSDNSASVVNKHKKDIVNEINLNLEDPEKRNLVQIIALKDYTALLNEKYKISSMSVKVVDNNNLEIKTVDGSIVNVSYESYHGFREVGTQFTECALCKDVFETKHKQNHIMSDNHFKLVSLPLENKHCIRKLNLTWSHCVLCNLAIENPNVHKLCNTEHNLILKQSLLSENKVVLPVRKEKSASVISDTLKHNKNTINNNNPNPFIKALSARLDIARAKSAKSNLDLSPVNDQNQEIQNKQKKHFCNDCNVFISNNKTLKKHLNTSKHHLNLQSDFHYLMKESDTQEWLCCRICEESVENSQLAVKKHVTSLEHFEIYKILLISNSIKQNTANILNKFFCSVCNEDIFAKNEIFHINSTDHKIKLDDSRNDGHLNEQTENTSVSPVIEEIVENFGNEAIKILNDNFCEICNVKVPNNERNIEAHNMGRSHITKMKQRLTSVTKEVIAEKKDDQIRAKIIEPSNETAKDDAKGVASTKKNIYYNLVTFDLVGTVKCLVCNVFLANNEFNISSHIKGLKHVKNYAFIIKENKLEINGNDIYCTLCSTNISIGNEVLHCQVFVRVNPNKNFERSDRYLDTEISMF